MDGISKRNGRGVPTQAPTQYPAQYRRSRSGPRRRAAAAAAETGSAAARRATAVPVQEVVVLPQPSQGR